MLCNNRHVSCKIIMPTLLLSARNLLLSHRAVFGGKVCRHTFRREDRQNGSVRGTSRTRHCYTTSCNATSHEKTTTQLEACHLRRVSSRQRKDASPSTHQGQQRYAVHVVPSLANGPLNNLHYIGCEEVMALLDECHARGFLYKAIGGCNGAKRDVNMCLRAERLERTKLNRERAKVERQKVVQRWQEIDANS